MRAMTGEFSWVPPSRRIPVLGFNLTLLHPHHISFRSLTLHLQDVVPADVEAGMSNPCRWLMLIRVQLAL